MSTRNVICENDRLVNDAELAKAVGGSRDTPPSKDRSIFCKTAVECGLQDKITGVITYFPCPRCGKPMHTEWYVAKWYCDPCNFSEYRPRKAIWNGTAEELAAAAR